MRQTIGELLTPGLFVRRRGMGTTVVKETVHSRAEFTNLYEDLARAAAH